MQNKRAVAYIDTDAYKNNLEQLTELLSPGTKYLAIIKADGYGHGADILSPIVKCDDNCFGAGVATVEEAIELIDDGFTKPVVLLGYAFPEKFKEIVRYDIRACVSSEDFAIALSEEAKRQNTDVHVHIKLDTGMSRLGFQVNEESADAIKRISELENVIIEGMFTHFSKADEEDASFTYTQKRRFDLMCRFLEDRDVRIPIKHISNSAAVMRFKDLNMDMVRFGIAQYGIMPSDDFDPGDIDLRPVLSFVSHISFLKVLPEGRIVSYGGTYKTESERLIATVPVGYADGYPRSLSGKGYVLIRGKRAPIAGRVCMDQFMVDVTDIPGVREGDKVTLIGQDKGECITVEELERLSGRFRYEITCDISKRVPRELIPEQI